MRAAVVHVMADAAVSVLVITGLMLARIFGWHGWTCGRRPASDRWSSRAWAYGLVRDTGAILLDMNPDRTMTERMRAVIETDGDRLTDLHVWRVGPGHLAAILSVETCQQRGPDYYQSQLRRFRSLSHVTVEVLQQ